MRVLTSGASKEMVPLLVVELLPVRLALTVVEFVNFVVTSM